MKDSTCADTKDLLPGLVRGELLDEEWARVEVHVSACADCSDEVALLRQIRMTTPAPPAGLAAEIKEAVARDRVRTRWLSGWRLPAAATVVLALGTALVWQRAQTLPETSQLAQESFLMGWASDDAFVAGASMLEELSEEDLALLLEELGG